MRNIKFKKRNIAVFLWIGNAYNAVILTDGEYWICVSDTFDDIDLYAENAAEKLSRYIRTNDFNSFNDMYCQGDSVGRNFSKLFSATELQLCGMIYE